MSSMTPRSPPSRRLPPRHAQAEGATTWTLLGALGAHAAQSVGALEREEPGSETSLCPVAPLSHDF